MASKPPPKKKSATADSETEAGQPSQAGAVASGGQSGAAGAVPGQAGSESPAAPDSAPAGPPKKAPPPARTGGGGQGAPKHFLVPGGKGAAQQKPEFGGFKKIDEYVFSLPEFKAEEATTPPPIYLRFVEKVLPRLRLASTSWQVLEAFAVPDVTAERVSHIIKENQYYEATFLRAFKAYARRENLEKLESAIVLLGMENSRNLIVAMQTVRAVTGEHFEWKEDGRIAIEPADVIKFALQTEEMVLSAEGLYPEVAFAAGLLYDVLSLIALPIAKDHPRLIPFIKKIYLHSLKTARIAGELVQELPDVVLAKYVFATCLLHDIGKAIIAVMDPTYIEFSDQCEKFPELTRRLIAFAEERRFGISHEALGGITCESVPMFSVIAKAIALHHEPYQLQGANSPLGQLSSILCLATNMANHFEVPDKTKPGDPFLKRWQGPELRDFVVDPMRLLKIAGKME